MMIAAREAVDAAAGRRPLLIAVTVLTSMDAADLADIGITVALKTQVSHLALLAEECALDGVVCSAQEATLLATERKSGFLRITPGIRPAGSAAGDQRRIVTPGDAIRAGSSYLVIGRPITGAVEPAQVLASINAEIAAALAP